MDRHEVVIAVYDGVQLLDAAGPLEVFDGASRLLAGRYRVRLASLGGRDVVTSSRVRLGVEIALEEITELGTLVVAGGEGIREAISDAELIRQIRRLAGLAERITSVCSGAFLLAEAGLLDGRRATTHWAMCHELAASYPAVTVEPDSIYVRDAPLVTAAGVTAGVDLALTLVEDDHGAEPARTLAKWLVVFLQRPGGQSQFSVWNSAPPVDDRALRELLGDISACPAGDYSVPAMAARLAMSPRHFTRLFTREVGTSPGRYVERARVEAARALLEAGRGGVARRCGFGSAETMRRAFLRQLGVPPSAYRDRFRTAG
ncbi:Transcriptional regulator GlxA family, contains an amidase domain and an AraC-type DNA-binding HTH domain [Saccharopolyspora shandongensis]|uniref:Transcriptional regulator GlxA family, contains an amidase domain and an AraC-type DNA-binding HTH domain n=1 Tax=Saccharopolyspora shandongensis TaxID=418495 RepID=A0A1H3T0Y8_9PSEU|nr:DJ-1/PfpI family protein [Saccharopolyspora shandongensis]SDZ43548.1 Transcriptional regulator GlxA family, contains an amidase domain and an AraC-type DNA-binding HTH domain [Saccharopolyspora shandongensis]